MKKLLIVVGILIFISACTTNSITGDATTPIVISEPSYAVMGDLEAPVTFIEYSDYQCGFCKHFTTETLPQIKEKYVDTGLVKFVFKDFPLEIHTEARMAGAAAHCAGEQGMYFEYHDIVFDRSKEISDSNLIAWAEELELNIDEFRDCFSSPESLAKVDASAREAKSLGMSGTPSFWINGEIVRGSQPLIAFEQIIERELNNEINVGELVDNPVCSRSLDCGESRTVGPYCSMTNPELTCVTTSTPRCEFAGTVHSECVVIVKEECNVFLNQLLECPETSYLRQNTEYVINSSASVLSWQAGKIIGGPHTGTVGISSGNLVRANGDFVSGEFVIDMSSITESENNERFVGHLMNEDFFYVEVYPTSTLKITEMSEISPSIYEITADLTVLNYTEQIVFASELVVEDESLNFKADFDIDRTKWGVVYNSKSIFATIGEKAIKDQILFDLDLVFHIE